MLCNKQNTQVLQTAFNFIRLNNHKKDTKDSDAILACRHFKQQCHNFNYHAIFIIIDQLVNTSSSKDILCERLIQQENFWIQKLKTLVLYGLNQELSKQKMKNPRAAFLRSILPRPQQQTHLRTQMMKENSKFYLASCND